MRSGVNSDSLAQPDARLRALNAQPSVPGQRQQGLLHQDRHDASDEM